MLKFYRQVYNTNDIENIGEDEVFRDLAECYGREDTFFLIHELKTGHKVKTEGALYWAENKKK